MRYVISSDGKYVIFDRAEADVLGIQYDHVREMTLDTNYILSDDGEVVPVIFTYLDKRADKVAAKTPLGWVKNDSKFYTRNSRGNSAFRRGSTVRKAKLYAFVVRWFLTGDIELAYREILLPHSDRHTRPVSSTALQKVLLSEEFTEVMRDAFQDILSSLGLDRQTVIDMYRRLFDESKNDRVRLEILDRFAMLVGLFQQKKALPAAEDLERRLASVEVYSPQDKQEADFEVVGTGEES